MGDVSMHELVYCGNNCVLCPKFADSSCGGCRTDNVAGDCRGCAPRNCCRERKLDNCGLCSEYSCEKTEAMYAKWTANGFAQGAVICKAILEAQKAGRR